MHKDLRTFIPQGFMFGRRFECRVSATDARNDLAMKCPTDWRHSLADSHMLLDQDANAWSCKAQN
eukprot:4499312-Pleurochrysis_carterae.AAC.6